MKKEVKEPKKNKDKSKKKVSPEIKKEISGLVKSSKDVKDAKDAKDADNGEESKRSRENSVYIDAEDGFDDNIIGEELVQDVTDANCDPAYRRCFENRELSWLKFNERVLNEAGNSRVPLAERLTFISIYQTNLDEFFMVRVGTLMAAIKQKKKKAKDDKTGMTCEEQVNAILERVSELEKKRARIYEQLMGELEPTGVRIINFNKLSNEESRQLEAYFDSRIAPYLSPMIIGRQQPFPFLENKHLYAVVMLQTAKGKRKLGIVPCTSGVLKRLIEIPGRPGNFILSEEIVLHFIGKLYPKYSVYDKSILRITRNADIDTIDVYDEDLDYRDNIEKLIKKRSRLNTVRAELSRKLNDDAVAELSNYLEINRKNIINVKTPLDFSFVFSIQNYLHGKAKLFYKSRTPRLSPAVNMRKALIPQFEKKDVLLSYPFESMKPFIEFLQEAAEDESVVSIKMTLYRVASRSKIVDALIDAAENGKEVVVLVELRARFDEANNIEMSHRLEEAGCQILYGLEDYKVHSKLCLITRSDGSKHSYITQIGTGNYNEKTATLYTDLCLITANQKIGAEAARVFTALQKGEAMDHTDTLLVAPRCLQNKILDMIDEQIKLADAGKPAYVGFKINSLTDKVIIDKFIEASQHGVKIELIVRGICCLIPKVKGYTENITVISVVGRYLEHSRIYRFGTGKDEKLYIASADLMTRNTVRRVEVAVPIYDKDIRKKIIHVFDTIMADDEKGKELIGDGSYIDRHVNDEKLNSQEVFFQEAYNALKKNAGESEKD